MSRNLINNLAERAKSKWVVLALSLGLAAGFSIGQGLHMSAECSSDEHENASSVSVPVKAAKSQDKVDEGQADSRFNGDSVSKRSLPSSMFEPWWRTMMHDPDADWILNHFDRVSSDFEPGWRGLNGAGSSSCRIDVDELDDVVKVVAEVPGIEAKDLDVAVTDDSITIKGEKKIESRSADNNSSGKQVQAIGRSYGMFQRTVRLPGRVESGKAVASLKNGVLSITIPKSHVAENQPKKLKIQTM